MRTSTTAENGQLQGKDLELIRKIAQAGNGEPYFTTHPAHEARAFALYQKGYLKRDQTLYAQRGSRKEYRWSYTLMIVHLVRAVQFQPSTYRCARCGLTSKSRFGLCEPVTVK